MHCRNSIRSVLIVLFPMALMLYGCSAMAPAYMDNLKASLVTNNVPAGSDHGTLEDVHRLYRNRQYSDALNGANFLLQNNSLSYNDHWVEFREAYMLRYRSNVALGNYDDVRRDYEALSALDWYEPAKVNGYLAMANLLSGNDAKAPADQLTSLSTSGQGSMAVGSAQWDNLMMRAEADFFQALIAIQLGEIDVSKAHFDMAQEKYQQAKTDLAGKMGVDSYIATADSYLRIIATYRSVLDEISDQNIDSLARLRAEQFYDPKAGSMIVKNWNWDMPFDPFLVDSSADALKNWAYLASEGNQQAINELVRQGKYLDAYATIGRAYRTARMADTVHQIAGMLPIHNPGDMTEEAYRYLAEANVHIERRDYAKAASVYLKIIEQSPWVVDAYYNLGQIYAAAGDYPNAIKSMEHFLILSPTGPRSREAKDSIYGWEVKAR